MLLTLLHTSDREQDLAAGLGVSVGLTTALDAGRTLVIALESTVFLSVAPDRIAGFEASLAAAHEAALSASVGRALILDLDVMVNLDLKLLSIFLLAAQLESLEEIISLVSVERVLSLREPELFSTIPLSIDFQKLEISLHSDINLHVRMHRHQHMPTFWFFR